MTGKVVKSRKTGQRKRITDCESMDKIWSSYLTQVNEILGQRTVQAISSMATLKHIRAQQFYNADLCETQLCNISKALKQKQTNKKAELEVGVWNS